MKRIAAVVAGLLLAFVGTSESFAATIHVPGDHTTIAAAISASVNGDVISIAAGTYNEHSLNPGGKAITIGSASGNLDVTIDAQHGGSVFLIQTGETSGTVIKDLVITGGTGTDLGGYPVGGGIFCWDTNPTITGCTISGNTADDGGGIFCIQSSPTITDCIISNNNTDGFGGGIACSDSSSPTIADCEILNNTTTGYNGGGGIACSDSSNPTITGCTIEGNTSFEGGGGIYCYDSSPIHSGCHFSGNTPDNVYGDSDWNPLRGEGGPSFITLENCTLCGTGDHVVGLINHLGENHISDCIDDGDLDGDGDVDTDDLSALHAALGVCTHDVNHNGITDIDDLLDVIEGWGQPCTP